MGNSKPEFLLTDYSLGSYVEIGNLYRLTFEAIVLPIEEVDLDQYLNNPSQFDTKG